MAGFIIFIVVFIADDGGPLSQLEQSGGRSAETQELASRADNDARSDDDNLAAVRTEEERPVRPAPADTTDGGFGPEIEEFDPSTLHADDDVQAEEAEPARPAPRGNHNLPAGVTDNNFDPRTN
ncbi:hypothetical protein BMF35_a1735 [Aurantiacibacter gangjinensis]|nr:hypothetical protein BMF35_a1735 [Aurantiacibacter gangjinensis]